MLQFSITAARITNKLYLYIISIYRVYAGYIYTLYRKKNISLLLLYIRSYRTFHHICNLTKRQHRTLKLTHTLLPIKNNRFSNSQDLIPTAWRARGGFTCCFTPFSPTKNSSQGWSQLISEARIGILKLLLLLPIPKLNRGQFFYYLLA